MDNGVKVLLAVVGGFLLLLLLGLFIGGGGMMGGGMMGGGMMGGGMMGDWGVFGWLWMLIPLLFVGGLLALIVWAISRAFPGQRIDERQEPRRESAEDILRERFARGEIDAGEYDSSLETLRGKNHTNS